MLFIAIVAFAFVIRLIYLAQARSVVFFELLTGDALGYDNWARRIVAGDWLGRDVFYQAPLYPYFLAATQLIVGHDLWWIRVVQISLGALSCGVIYLAGTAFFGRAAGIAAGVILAIYAPAIFFDGLIQKAVLDLLWMALLLWLIARCQQRVTAVRCAAAGATLGLLCLTRENALALVPVMLVWLIVTVRRKSAAASTPKTRAADDPNNERESPNTEAAGTLRPATRAVIAMLAGLGAVLLPVGIRNYAVGGEFALTTSQAGTNFYIGNNPKAVGTYVPLRPGRSSPPEERQDAIELAEQACKRKLTAGEVSRFWFGEAWAFIASHPEAWLQLLGRKLLWTVNSYEIPDTEDIAYYAIHSPLLASLGRVGHLGVLLPLASIGIVLTWPQRRQVWVLYAIALTIVAGVALFYVFGRYRYAMVPVLALFAGAGIVEIGRAIRADRRGALFVAALAALVTYRLSNASTSFPQDTQIALSYSNAGFVLHDQGRSEDAAAQFRAAARIAPKYMNAHYGLGLALARLGRTDESITAFEDALRVSPDAAQVHLSLGATLTERGDLDAAATHLERAARLWPGDADVLNKFGKLYLRKGEWKRALDALEKAATGVPDDAEFTIDYAWALATTPDGARRDGAAAIRLVGKLADAPGNQQVRALDVLGAGFASQGRFKEAADAARRAHSLCVDAHMKSEIAERLKLYESGKRFTLPRN